MNARRIIMGVLALALLAGWLLAPPGKITAPGAGDGFPDVPGPTEAISKAEVEQALASLYRRNVWSAGTAPEFFNEQQAGAEQDNEVREQGQRASGGRPEQEVPEGLDRYTLVGIIRVQGQPAEALLIDAQAQANNQPGSLRVREGESLQDSGIQLATIDDFRVQLRQAGESRWLELFGPIETGATGE